jgi:hypothetical protein
MSYTYSNQGAYKFPWPCQFSLAMPTLSVPVCRYCVYAISYKMYLLYDEHKSYSTLDSSTNPTTKLVRFTSNQKCTITTKQVNP